MNYKQLFIFFPANVNLLYTKNKAHLKSNDYVLEEKWQVAHVIPKVAHANIFVLENVS